MLRGLQAGGSRKPDWFICSLKVLGINKNEQELISWVVYKALKRIFKVNLGASLVVGTRLDRKFAREIDGKLLEKQIKTPPNTSLMPPLNTRKLLINHPALGGRGVNCAPRPALSSSDPPLWLPLGPCQHSMGI